MGKILDWQDVDDVLPEEDRSGYPVDPITEPPVITEPQDG